MTICITCSVSGIGVGFTEKLRKAGGMKSFEGKRILITGGAHGIGLALAKRYAALHAVVIILDINTEALKVASEKLPEVRFFRVDITNKDEVYKTAQTIRETLGTPSIIVNNAGVVENATFLDCEDDLLERTMKVNILSHFWILKAFLPEMIKAREGHICEIASAAGIVGVPGMAAYCASKHAVVGFAHSLQLELQAMAGNAISLTLICPSFINTGLFKGAKPPMFTSILDENKIAEIIFKAIESKKFIVYEPFAVKLIPILRGVLPHSLFYWVLRLLRVNQSMKEISHL